MSGKSPVLLFCGLCFICFSRWTSAKKTDQEKANFHEKVKEKCGFSLDEIFDCKRNAVLASIQNCSSSEDLHACFNQMKAKAIIECEAPLNKHLTKEEVCLGNGIEEVTAKCKIPESLEHLKECKVEAFVQVKRKCYEPKWKEHIMERARLQEKDLGDMALECTYKLCFNHTDECLRKKKKDVTATAVKFSLEHCAHISAEKPEDCEKPGCDKELDGCMEKYPNKKGTGLIISIIIVAAFLLVIALVGVLVYFLRKKKAQSG